MRTATSIKSTPKAFKRKPYVFKYAKEAVRQAMGRHTDPTVIYHSAFPIGKALADVIAIRAADGSLPSGLTALLGELLGHELSRATPEQAARRGLICGLFWEIQTLLGIGGSGGFRFLVTDEVQILNEAVSESRAAAGSARSIMAADDGGNK